MGSACCCEGILTGTKADQVHDHGDQAAPIVPKATDAAKALVETAMSMLAWERSKLSQKEDAVRRYILMKYPLLGLAPSFQEIGEALGLTLKVVQTILEHLDKLDILVLDPERPEIRLAYPFSTVPTRHVVRFYDWDEAKPVNAQCAIDALGIPFMFGHDLSVVSLCAHCSKPITIEVRGRMIVAHNPAETVVWAGTTRSGHAATSVCPTINFFCSSDDVAAWLQDRAEATGSMVSLAEALYIGKEIFEPLLRAPSGSTSPTTENARTDRPDRAALTAASMGGLAAAFLASMCCVGPLVFAALGVGVGATGFLAGTAGFLKALLPYRPFFIGLTVLMLGLSLYLAYQKPKAVCLPSSVCAPQGGGRPRTMLWAIAVIALVLVLAPYWLALL